MKSVFYYCVEMSRRPFNICFRCIRSNSVRLPHPQVFPPETHQQFFFFLVEVELMGVEIAQSV